MTRPSFLFPLLQANEEGGKIESNGHDEADVGYQKHRESQSDFPPDGHRVNDAQAQADAILNRLKTVVTYGIEDNPPWHTTIILAFQVKVAYIFLST